MPAPQHLTLQLSPLGTPPSPPHPHLIGLPLPLPVTFSLPCPSYFLPLITFFLPFLFPLLALYTKVPGIPPQKAWLKNMLGGSWLLAFLGMLSTQQLYGCQGAISVPLGQSHNQLGRPVPPLLLPRALSGFYSNPHPQPIIAQFIHGGPSAPVSFHLNYLHIQGD